MSDSWDDYASDWDKHSDVISYAQNAFESLQQAVQLSNQKILDFGCGTGQLTQRLATVCQEVVALDSAPKMIEVLDKKQLKGVTSLACELSENSIQQHVPLQQKFDLIVASSVCTFLEDYPASLKLIKELLKDNGTFVQWDWHAEDGSTLGFSQDFVSNALKQAGFKTVTTSLPFTQESSKGNKTVLMAVASL